MLFSHSPSPFRSWSSLAALVVLLFGVSLLSASPARADDDDSAADDDDSAVADDDDSAVADDDDSAVSDDDDSVADDDDDDSAVADDDDSVADDDDSAVDDDDSSSGGWSQGAAQAAGDLNGCSCGESMLGMNLPKPSAALLALTLVFVAMRRRRSVELL